jgi:hypothetical protein
VFGLLSTRRKPTTCRKSRQTLSHNAELSTLHQERDSNLLY